MASIAIGSIIKSGNRIKIRANLGGQLANVLIDSGAACSCTDIPLPLTNEMIKHFNIITSIWQEIRARDSSLSVVKVRAHIIKNPDENEKNNNIADQLAKLAAQKGDEWKPDRLVVPAVSAIQPIPIDLKQYQQELWSSDGELTWLICTCSRTN